MQPANGEPDGHGGPDEALDGREGRGPAGSVGPGRPLRHEPQQPAGGAVPPPDADGGKAGGDPGPGGFQPPGLHPAGDGLRHRHLLLRQRPGTL